MHFMVCSYSNRDMYLLAVGGRVFGPTSVRMRHGERRGAWLSTMVSYRTRTPSTVMPDSFENMPRNAHTLVQQSHATTVCSGGV